MLETIGTYLLYLLAFLIGSLIALLVARRMYPATSEEEALDELDFASLRSRR